MSATSLPGPSRIVPAEPWRGIGALLATLLVFAAAIALLGDGLRGRLRAQVLRREGEVLHAVALMQRDVVVETTAELGLEGVDQTLEVALHTSKLRGVLAVRLFDAAGAFLDAVPVEVFETTLAPDEVDVLSGAAPTVRFHPHLALDALFVNGEKGTRAPVLEVALLLPSGDSGAGGTLVQYWIDGSAVAAEFSRIDAQVARQALVGFAVGGVLIAGAFGWAFLRLNSSNHLLRRQAAELALANRELAQSARTSAIGAITAHLMHGLRNPLAGLEDFVAAQGAETEDRDDEWALALDSTRRLRALVNEVQEVMRDLATPTEFEMTTGELCAGLQERLQVAASARRVRLEFLGPEDVTIGGREAGLCGFVLANLVQNAIEASPPGLAVTVTISAGAEAAAVDFRVRDHGPGLRAAATDDPFRPRPSTKPDGAGIGLAISHELARHAGGELVLEHTGAEGTVFRLRIPIATNARKGVVA